MYRCSRRGRTFREVRTNSVTGDSVQGLDLGEFFVKTEFFVQLCLPVCMRCGVSVCFEWAEFNIVLLCFEWAEFDVVLLSH